MTNKKISRNIYTSESHVSGTLEQMIDALKQMQDHHYEKCKGQIERHEMKFNIEVEDDGYDYKYAVINLSDTISDKETDEEKVKRLVREQNREENELSELKRLTEKYLDY